MVLYDYCNPPVTFFLIIVPKETGKASLLVRLSRLSYVYFIQDPCHLVIFSHFIEVMRVFCSVLCCWVLLVTVDERHRGSSDFSLSG